MTEQRIGIIVKILFWLAIILLGIKLIFIVFHLAVNYVLPVMIFTILAVATVFIVGTGFASLPRHMAKSIEPEKKKKKFKY